MWAATASASARNPFPGRTSRQKFRQRLLFRLLTRNAGFRFASMLRARYSAVPVVASTSIGVGETTTLPASFIFHVEQYPKTALG